MDDGCRRITLPRGGGFVTAEVTDNVVISLRGDFYESGVAPEQDDVDPDRIPTRLQADGNAVRKWSNSEAGDQDGEIPGDRARLPVTLEMPFGWHPLTWQAQRNISCLYFEISDAQAIADLCGGKADTILAERQLHSDGALGKLVTEIARAVRQGGPRLLRKLDGDSSPDGSLARFPAFEQQAMPATAATRMGPSVKCCSKAPALPAATAKRGRRRPSRANPRSGVASRPSAGA